MLVCKLTEARFGAGGHRGAGKLTKLTSRTESNSLGSIMFALKEGVVSQSVLCAGQRSEKKKVISPERRQRGVARQADDKDSHCYWGLARVENGVLVRFGQMKTFDVLSVGVVRY